MLSLFALFISTCLHGLNYFTDGQPASEIWPPRDPAAMHDGDPNKEFVLPDSPWTYENGSINPDLQPSNSAAAPRLRKRTPDGTSALPPYHPDYQPGGGTADDDETSEEEDDYRYADSSTTRVRRGSEGYEVRPGAREDMLARYLLEIGETPQKYHRYIPMESSESEGDDVPLGQQLHH